MKKIMVTRSSMPPIDEYVEMIKPLWDTHWLTNMGEYHNRLEQELKRFLDTENLCLMVNGHMALELALTALKLPQGSEVITTPFTFISTTHAIVRNGLVPVFCDIKMEDYTIDETKIEALITEKTSAILPVHVYGRICNVEKIKEIADKYNLKVIYDAAHAFGVKYKEESVANFGDASIFSFHATKVFNTIEGGCITFREKGLETVLKDLKNFGIRSEEVVSEIGANAKMNEFSAAMGLCNIRHLDEEIQKRKRIVEIYRESMRDVEGIRILESDPNLEENFAYFPILVDKNTFGVNRDEIYDKLKESNIFSRKYFYPLTSDQACFRNRYMENKLDNARFVAKNILVLPLYADLQMDAATNIVNIIKRMRV